MAVTISGTDGIVGAGFTVDGSGVSVTAGVGTFSSLQGSGANLTALPAANLTGTLPALNAASLTSIPAANIVGVCTSGLTKTGGFGGITQADQWRINANFDSTGEYITLLLKVVFSELVVMHITMLGLLFMQPQIIAVMEGGQSHIKHCQLKVVIHMYRLVVTLYLMLPTFQLIK